MKPTIPEVVAACQMVAANHPYVDHLFISVDARWLFCDGSFEAPTFGDETDIGLLEDMIHALCNGGHEFPTAFYIPELL